MRALVTAEWDPAGTHRLAALGYQVERAGWGATGTALTADELVHAATGCALLVVEVEQVGEDVLERLPDLRLVATCRGGPVNVDAAACARRGLPVISTPGRNADSVADFTVGLLLSLTRGIGAGERQLRERGWLVEGQLPYLHFRGPELSRLTVGVVGMGAIGGRVAQRLRDGFGASVPHSDPAVPGGLALDELLERSDVVTLHCPRTAETRGLLDARRLGLLRPSSYLLNTAGGGIVDEAALVDALEAGRLAGAALDVFATEPLPADSPLLRARNLLLTPHLAGASWDVVARHTDAVCTQVERLSRA